MKNRRLWHKLVTQALFLAGASACSVAHSGAAAVEAPSSARGGIPVGPQSNVCVAVHVDQRIWPRPLDIDSARNFSGHLMTEIRRLYEQRGGSDNLPNTQNEARFVSEGLRANPSCQDRKTDVFIDVRYEPRPDGAPFLMSYRITRGSNGRSGRIDVNVAEEIRAGRMRGFNQRRTIESVIFEDMWVRARTIADQLIIGEKAATIARHGQSLCRSPALSSGMNRAAGMSLSPEIAQRLNELRTRPMAGNEAEALVRGKTVVSHTEAGVGGGDRKELFEDGCDYTLYAERVTLRGTYFVTPASICTRLVAGEVACRTVHRSSDGQIFAVFIGDDGRGRELQSVKIQGDPKVLSEIVSRRAVVGRAGVTSGFQTLTSAELSHLLVGHSLKLAYVDYAARRPMLTESFLANKKYKAIDQTEYTYSGTYQIKSSKVCVNVPNHYALCYRLFKSKEGSYFRQLEGVGESPEPVLIDAS
ncbi:MAG TPA: hypothetical protein VGD66_11130 [Allosphingosinicella sp.]